MVKTVPQLVRPKLSEGLTPEALADLALSPIAAELYHVRDTVVKRLTAAFETGDPEEVNRAMLSVGEAVKSELRRLEFLARRIQASVDRGSIPLKLAVDCEHMRDFFSQYSDLLEIDTGIISNETEERLKEAVSFLVEGRTKVIKNKDFATRCGITGSHLSNWRYDRRTLSGEHLQSVADLVVLLLQNANVEVS